MCGVPWFSLPCSQQFILVSPVSRKTLKRPGVIVPSRGYCRGEVTRPVLNALIVASSVLLGVLHYKLKPSPTNMEVRDQARTMIGFTEWRGQIAPNFELKTNEATLSGFQKISARGLLF